LPQRAIDADAAAHLITAPSPVRGNLQGRSRHNHDRVSKMDSLQLHHPPWHACEICPMRNQPFVAGRGHQIGLAVLTTGSQNDHQECGAVTVGRGPLSANRPVLTHGRPYRGFGRFRRPDLASAQTAPASLAGRMGAYVGTGSVACRRKRKRTRRRKALAATAAGNAAPIMSRLFLADPHSRCCGPRRAADWRAAQCPLTGANSCL
jgi:hypothetical protein